MGLVEGVVGLVVEGVLHQAGEVAAARSRLMSRLTSSPPMLALTLGSVLTLADVVVYPELSSERFRPPFQSQEHRH